MEINTRFKFVSVVVFVWVFALSVALIVTNWTPYSLIEVTGSIGMLGTLGIFTVSVIKWLDGSDSYRGNSQSTEKSDKQGNEGTLIDPFEARKERAKKRLKDRISLSENHDGNIEMKVDTNGIRNVDRSAMLYVFAKWAAADESPHFDPIVTKAEIREETELSGGAVSVFLAKMDDFLKRDYPEDADDGYITNDNVIVEELDENEMKFKINIDEIDEIVDYIQGDRPAPN